MKFKLKLNYTHYDIGGARYLKTGEVLPDSVLAELRKFPAILLGAIGHPDVKPGILEKGILLRTRFELEQYINLRPVKLYDARFCPLKDKKPEHIDFVVVRENNEGLYTGAGGFVFKDTPNEIALQECINTRRGVERCLRFAFEFCRKRKSGTPKTPAHAQRQDKRAHLRVRFVGTRVSRDRRKISRHQARLRPRGRHLTCGS